MSLLSPLTGDEDHEAFRDSVRRFLVAHLNDRLDDWRANDGFDPAFLHRAGDDGFLGATIPEEFGGGGADDPRFAAVLIEEVAAAGAPGLALVLARQIGVGVPALLRLDAGGRAEFIPEVASGHASVCFVDLNDDLAATGVPGAGLADIFIVRTPAAPGTVTVLRRDEVEVSDAARPLAGRESAVADVRVEADVLAFRAAISDVDDAIQAGLDLWSAVVSIGAARGALELTLAYVQERKVFGQPIANFENTRFRLAELGAELAAAQSLVGEALTRLRSGALGPEHAAAARWVSAGLHDRVVDQGMQFHGGYGYMREYPISHAFGDARFLRVAAAASREPRGALAAALGI